MKQRADAFLAFQLKALGDETRLAIIECLGNEECCVCELMETLALPQSLLSFHLGVLKRAGLVRGRREGRWSYYVRDEDAVRDVSVAVQRMGTSRTKRRRRAC